MAAARMDDAAGVPNWASPIAASTPHRGHDHDMDVRTTPGGHGREWRDGRGRGGVGGVTASPAVSAFDPHRHDHRGGSHSGASDVGRSFTGSRSHADGHGGSHRSFAGADGSVAAAQSLYRHQLQALSRSIASSARARQHFNESGLGGAVSPVVPHVSGRGPQSPWGYGMSPAVHSARRLDASRGSHHAQSLSPPFHTGNGGSQQLSGVWHGSPMSARGYRGDAAPGAQRQPASPHFAASPVAVTPGFAVSPLAATPDAQLAGHRATPPSSRRPPYATTSAAGVATPGSGYSTPRQGSHHGSHLSGGQREGSGSAGAHGSSGTHGDSHETAMLSQLQELAASQQHLQRENRRLALAFQAVAGRMLSLEAAASAPAGSSSGQASGLGHGHAVSPAVAIAQAQARVGRRHTVPPSLLLTAAQAAALVGASGQAYVHAYVAQPAASGGDGGNTRGHGCDKGGDDTPSRTGVSMASPAPSMASDGSSAMFGASHSPDGVRGGGGAGEGGGRQRVVKNPFVGSDSGSESDDGPSHGQQAATGGRGGARDHFPDFNRAFEVVDDGNSGTCAGAMAGRSAAPDRKRVVAPTPCCVVAHAGRLDASIDFVANMNPANISDVRARSLTVNGVRTCV